MQRKLLRIYQELSKKHGKQNWWSTTSKNKKQKQFEIIFGAVLTQNTSWKNVEKTINLLHKNNLINPKRILNIKTKKLAKIIKSCGYYNQKAHYLKNITKFYTKNKNKIPKRDELLKIKGIGKETADSILLYAFNKPYFVIDTYTKRFFKEKLNLNFENYDEWQDFFHKNLPKNPELFKEFHALIVEDGKNKR